MQQIETRGAPVKAWVDGVTFEPAAREQVERIAQLPFIHRHVAVMPDVHLGIGATVGSVIATRGAVIPAAVGVDIGCGMLALETDLSSKDLPASLAQLRSAIERAVPHGRTHGGGANDRGAWKNPPSAVVHAWNGLRARFETISRKHAQIARSNQLSQLGTLGTGNHFIEICLDTKDNVWVLLHSGSRGVGNRIGSYFIELAKKDMGRLLGALPDKDLAYLEEGSEHFDDYVEAVGWAQDFARTNRELMLDAVLVAAEKSLGRAVGKRALAINCHHNYVEREHHFGADVLVTRKGAVRARRGDLGIIPGSMGAKSYIVRGKGNPESFCSCSHGAGRSMSRTEAKRRFTLEDHERATAGVECRKDRDVIDETPGAYKPIDAVMAAQSDLVEVLHELKQVLCVKG